MQNLKVCILICFGPDPHALKSAEVNHTTLGKKKKGPSRTGKAEQSNGFLKGYDFLPTTDVNASLVEVNSSKKDARTRKKLSLIDGRFCSVL